LRDVDVAEVLDQRLHVVLTEFSRWGDQPVSQRAQLADMELEKLHVCLSLLVVLVVLFLSEGQKLLLNCLQTAQYFIAVFSLFF